MNSEIINVLVNIPFFSQSKHERKKSSFDSIILRLGFKGSDSYGTTVIVADDTVKARRDVIGRSAAAIPQTRFLISASTVVNETGLY